MKSLLSVLALSAALGFAAGCGPQEAFCPNSDAAGGVCPVIGDDVQVKVMDMAGGACSSDEYLGDDPNNPNGAQICLCKSTSNPPPC